jgi:triosephosphate isomerase (TIM)
MLSRPRKAARRGIGGRKRSGMAMVQNAVGVRPLVAGNWKMNGTKGSLAEVAKVKGGLGAGGLGADVMICPPATLIAALTAAAGGSPLLVGGQDCHAEPGGAHTGDISAEMLKDAGAVAVIVGHSERRADHGETNAAVRAKAGAAYRAGLIAIVCVGETAAERKDGKTLGVVAAQLAGSLPGGATAANTVVAYEPVWAIGTGLTPTVQDVAQVHAAARQLLADRYGEEGRRMRILYGGSVKPANARELMGVANVDGALVGGASLKAEDFLGIIAAYA